MVTTEWVYLESLVQIIEAISLSLPADDPLLNRIQLELYAEIKSRKMNAVRLERMAAVPTEPVYELPLDWA